MTIRIIRDSSSKAAKSLYQTPNPKSYLWPKKTYPFKQSSIEPIRRNPRRVGISAAGRGKALDFEHTGSPEASLN